MTDCPTLSTAWTKLGGPPHVINATNCCFILGNTNGVPLVDCNGGRITALRLRQRGFNQELPTELGSLISLTELNLADNQITGSIPAWIGNLVNLKSLYAILICRQLQNNALRGAIPSQIGSLKQIESL